jgi:hypothetical protein
LRVSVWGEGDGTKEKSKSISRSHVG